MARPLRIDAPGFLHHVMVRGNEQRPIFRSDSDREAYLERVARAHARLEFHLLAYCLMTDHAHFAIRSGPVPLARVMQSISTSYAQYFNRRHDRVGHLFQGRYKAILVQEERYFLTLLRYIHLNPVEQGMCARAEQHRWSSAGAFFSGQGPDWLDLDEAMRLIDGRRPAARRAYRALMGRPLEPAAYPVGTIQGDEGFVQRVTRARESSLTRDLDLSKVASTVTEALGGSPKELRARTPRSGRLRAAIAYVAREEGEISVARTARLFRRSESSLARAVRTLEVALTDDAFLRSRLAHAVDEIRRSAPVRIPRASADPFRGSRIRRGPA